MNKQLMATLGAVLLLPALSACAAKVFDGYEAYYRTLPNRLFPGHGHALTSASLEGDDAERYEWHGRAAGRQQKAVIREGQLSLNGQVLRPRLAKVFPGEFVGETDLGFGTTAYFAPGGWSCFENTPSSASGSAVRHKVVYLIKQSRQHQKAWLLPSLFASCQAIRWHNEMVLFSKATYRSQPGSDESPGIVFDDYVIRGHEFAAIGTHQRTQFIEPVNVYKFRLLPN